MVAIEDKLPSPAKKRRRKILDDKPEEENSSREQSQESFLVCDDCRHNSIRYDPAKDGACQCGCH